MALLTRRVTNYLLIFLALFLIGTIAFLSTVNAYFSIATSAYITPDELGTWEEIKYGASELQSKDALDFAQRHPLLAKWVLLPSSSPSSETVGKSGFVEGSPQDLSDGDGTSGKDRIFRDNSPKPPNPDSPPEKIPRIIHQTWKDTVLPPRWKAVRDECAKMHPDYEYMLWTDASSRQFLVDHYSWFLPVFDNYPYPIQRADAIRYFVLHHYGGIYMDLDIGCLRRFDPLLRFEVILPRTIPVGVSNDLLLSSPGHPFMDQLIHTLVTFNHQYLTHYPTVMFSTGPMFVSASYGIFTSAHGSAAPSSTKAPALGFTGVRILPKSLYGKNAKPGEAPDAFFSHYYGSSWHANDAGFLIFLRDHGKFMMFIGGLIVAYGALRIVAPRVLGVSTLGGGRRRRSTPGRWISLAVSGSGSGSSSGGNNSRRSTSGQRSSNRKSSRQSWGTGGGGGEMRRGNEDDEDFSVPMNASIPKDSPPSSRFLSSNENNGSINSNLGGGGGLGPRSMAAPKPQRLSLPLFELQEDQENENLDSPRDSEGGSLTGASSLLAWVGNSLSRPSSRNDGLDQFSTSPITTTSPSPFKKKISSSNSGTLYLPAYFVNNNSSSKNGHGGGGLDDDSSTSSSPSISTNGRINDISGHNSSWGVHSRRASATLGNWASGLLPSGWRTPSPSTAFNPSSGIGMGRRESQSNGTRSPSPIHLNGGGGTIDLESLGGGNEKESSLPTLINSSNAYSSGPFNGAGQGRSFSGNLIPGTSTAASPPPNESQQHQHFSSLSEGFLNIHDKDKVQTLKSPSSIHRNFSGSSSSANQSGSTTPLASQSISSGDQIGGGGGRLVRRTSNQNLNGSGNHLTSISISSGSMSLSPKHEEPPNLNQDQDGGSHGSDGAPPPPYFDRSLENSVKDDEKR